MPRIPSRPPLDLSGKWAVVEMPSMSDDYLGLLLDAHVLITHDEFERFSATFQFGAQEGDHPCHLPPSLMNRLDLQSASPADLDPAMAAYRLVLVDRHPNFRDEVPEQLPNCHRAMIFCTIALTRRRVQTVTHRSVCRTRLPDDLPEKLPEMNQATNHFVAWL